ncbi:MAG: XdhC family protein [Paracoccaceae bacterium]|nr:XdhC family protein [Paracoccaceae bacterium]
MKLDQLLKAAESFVLVTAIETWGSAPKPVGSMLIVNKLGQIFGSVSGGCVEGSVITEALDILDTTECKILTFSVSDGDAFQVGLACGGEIKILLEPISKKHTIASEKLQSFLAEYFNGNLVIYSINLTTFERKVIKDSDEDFTNIPMEPLNKRISFKLDDTFFSVLYPRLRLIIIGAVHIAQYLVNLAEIFEYQILVVDPRSTFASKARFPTAGVLTEWPDVALNEIQLNQDSALITLTHDPKIDDIALEKALQSDCYYIGSLGSKRTHAKRIDRLKLLGFTNNQLKRIKGPVGLDIGAKTPSEIALSIMAEIISVQRGFQ